MCFNIHLLDRALSWTVKITKLRRHFDKLEGGLALNEFVLIMKKFLMKEKKRLTELKLFEALEAPMFSLDENRLVACLCELFFLVRLHCIVGL